MLYNAKKLAGFRMDSLNGEIGKVKEFYFTGSRSSLTVFILFPADFTLSSQRMGDAQTFTFSSR